MTVSKGRLPRGREEMLDMASAWAAVLGKRGARWKVPPERIAGLAEFARSAAEKLETAKAAPREPLITAECKSAFRFLAEDMKDILGRWFRSPPLNEADYAALLLTAHAATSLRTPRAAAVADLAFPGLAAVEIVRIRPVESGAALDACYGTRMFWGLNGRPSSRFPSRLSLPPVSAEELPYSLFTRRQRHEFNLEGESGNTLWLCLRYENSKGKSGPFGPILETVIP